MSNKKEPTIYDLAERLNVSGSTISRALSNHHSISKKTRKKVEKLAEEMGYRKNNFASQLKKKKTQTIGVIVHELDSHFITSVLSGIEKVATESQYDIIIGHSAESSQREKANAENLFGKRVDGLIASLAFDTSELDHYQPFVKKKVPLVFFDRVEENTDGIKIVINNKAAAYEATKHLIDQGCKRIMHVTGNLSRNVYSDRFEGYKAALADHKIKFDKKYLRIVDFTEQAGLEIAQDILEMDERPDGLFIINDQCAAICMHQLILNGVRVPEDMAIVGFNNDIISRVVEPQITTINYDGREMGEIAAQHLMGQINSSIDIPYANYTVTLNSELIVRSSSQVTKPAGKVNGIEK